MWIAKAGAMGERNPWLAKQQFQPEGVEFQYPPMFHPFRVP